MSSDVAQLLSRAQRNASAMAASLAAATKSDNTPEGSPQYRSKAVGAEVLQLPPSPQSQLPPSPTNIDVTNGPSISVAAAQASVEGRDSRFGASGGADQLLASGAGNTMNWRSTGGTEMRLGDVTADVNANTMDFLEEQNQCRLLRVSDPGGQLDVLDYIQYLGIDLQLEPHLSWIAREMLAAPMPPGAEMLISKLGIVYFYDVENDFFTLEHPLTQRYLKALEKSRIETLALSISPLTQGLLLRQPDVLFHREFRTLQIPCQDCGVFPSALVCRQCLMSFCDNCFQLLHNKGRRAEHQWQRTVMGSSCSVFTNKKPQCYCAACEDFFSFEGYKSVHSRGGRTNHAAMLLPVADSELIDTSVKCEECDDRPAAFLCDQCGDRFCPPCFWRCHFNGNRRYHTVSKAAVAPLCSQCEETRASVFCEQCQELYCTECFTLMHVKGNRRLHLFSDAMNFLLLLETMDPHMHEAFRLAQRRIMRQICRLQAWMRGIDARRYFTKHRATVLKIQRMWRGARARAKLARVLDHLRWRRKNINDWLLDKEVLRQRRQLKQMFKTEKFKEQLVLRKTKRTVDALRGAIEESAGVNPLEDIETLKRTLQAQPPKRREEREEVPASPVDKTAKWETLRRALVAPPEGTGPIALPPPLHGPEGPVAESVIRKMAALKKKEPGPSLSLRLRDEAAQRRLSGTKATRIKELTDKLRMSARQLLTVDQRVEYVHPRAYSKPPKERSEGDASRVDSTDQATAQQRGTRSTWRSSARRSFRSGKTVTLCDGEAQGLTAAIGKGQPAAVANEGDKEEGGQLEEGGPA
ncbi:unnamed protein product [Vitrella brassicaformis CCMP3155]|uniref:B box-type domain-containing protein n=3 Tax=Vitrella brassicaformis TaxID=1169539 RepID=A0A0G4FTP2_VITBC|nr:unnamed protein product [Vitrella brassicaformis CCMP3155]|eukprot:CEM18311.1 unnamed protein product [Vitrella brassicaformis CCMP3155]